MLKLAAASILAIAWALVAVSSVRGQGADVRIVGLQCSGDPELVVIENRGDAAQDLAGWKLESDPAASEVFDLSAVGGLQPGASVTIQSGPSASGVFKWGQQPVFRDNDATDYARLVNNTGATVQQVNCAGAGATPTPIPSPASTAIPNGGGPPPPGSDALSRALVVVIGGSVVAAAVVTVALPWLRLRPSAAASPSWRGVAARRHAESRPDRRRGELLSAASGLALLWLMAMVIQLLRRSRA